MWSGVSQVAARDSSTKPITLYGDGDQTRNFTYVHDAVTETVAPATLGVPGRVYNGVYTILEADRGSR
jgi:dTDP-D-glucose 4,6-dehydratase